MFGAGTWGNDRCRSKPLLCLKKSKYRLIVSANVWMKERNGSTGVETRHRVADQLEHAEQGEGRQSFTGTPSKSRRQFRKGRLPVAIAGLAIALVVGVFFVSY